MSSISGCTLVRNTVKLNYPLEASILTYYPICDEVVIAYDPTTEDGTERFIRDLARRYPKIRPVPSPWNMENHKDGTEITIQSNVAVEAASGDWVLYVQADEAIHEGDHEAIRSAVQNDDLNAVLFDRWSFLSTLDREIPEHYFRGLLRLYRNGQGCVVGDGTTCGLFQGVRPIVHPRPFRMYNYSRMGAREEVLLRSRYRDAFHHSTQEAIEDNQKKEYTQSTRAYNPGDHPAAIRRWYSQEAEPKAVHRPPRARASFPISLACLLGGGERENMAPFLWQFRGWPGEILVLDDMTTDDSGVVAAHTLATVLGMDTSRFRIIREPLGGDFAAARNKLQDLAQAPWVLACDLDERWDGELLRNILSLTAQLERDGKTICGFPRANFIDGILANDIPDSEWSEAGLLGRNGGTAWPPQNLDAKYRLVRREERWQGRIHEDLVGLSSHPERVVALRDVWILHNKTLNRQRRQDAFYRSLGQRRGMPASAPPEGPSFPSLREETLKEAFSRLPHGPLTVVETGTLRDPSPAARMSDGWSTYCLAELLASRSSEGSRFYSLDINSSNIEVSKSVLPQALHGWVTWIHGDSAKTLAKLEVPVIDLLYLDSADDPNVIMAEFETALPKLKPHSLVVVDDTGPQQGRPEGKGTVVIPAAREIGWRVEYRKNGPSQMTILSQKS